MVTSMDSSVTRAPTPHDSDSDQGLLQAKADHGDAEAQYHLGAHYHRASVDTLRSDATESRIEAFRWFQLAAAQEYKDALNSCHRVTLTMSRAEFEEGKRRVAAFVVHKQT
jgi:hypothetical protein